MTEVTPIRWLGDALELLDQRHLPHEERYLRCQSAAEVASAITEMVVRGAPAIAISAAYGMALAARQSGLDADTSAEVWQQALVEARQTLADSRPTAVNLFWALAKVDRVIANGGDLAEQLTALAIRLHQEDRQINERIGQHGARLLPDAARVYTHCNTGALATGGLGTALGIIREAHKQGQLAQVFAGETRPWLQGARLTAWELQREAIPVKLCIEGAAGSLLRDAGISWVIVGADRVTANGDVANKIGTYNLAVLARYHGVRFMAAVPLSTIDEQLASGTQIPIENRPAEEVTHLAGRPVAPLGVEAVNPAFDVTPAELIDAIVTEFGVIEQPNRDKMAAHLAAARQEGFL